MERLDLNLDKMRISWPCWGTESVSSSLQSPGGYARTSRLRKEEIRTPNLPFAICLGLFPYLSATLFFGGASFVGSCLAASLLLSFFDYQGWVIDAMEILVVAFVLEDIATTFELGSVGKGLIGSASFFGKARSTGASGWGPGVGVERVTDKEIFPGVSKVSHVCPQ